MGDSPKKKKKRAIPATVAANVSNTRYGIVRTCCEELGYTVTESDARSLLFWCDAGGSFEFTSTLEPWQFYNHFPGTWAIARKVELCRNIERMGRLLPNLYNFHPKSFIVPCQTTELQSYMNAISRKSRRTFIVKPDRGSLGKGIVIVRDPDALDDMYDLAIAQEYIPPFLIDNLKFDLRIYALVTSVDPLRIYLHEEGMARFCTHPYSKPRGGNQTISFAHLTNYSLNKHNPKFEEPSDADHADHGHKRSLSAVLKLLEERGVDVEKLKAQIENIIRLTVISIQPLLATNYRTAIPWHDGKCRCFEILGFDIMIDRNVVPWLLEVNWAPSLATGSPFDTAIKSSVVKGALKIVNIHPNFKRIFNARRKTASMGRDPGPVFHLGDELELAKETAYRLIYPLDPSHPMFEQMEMAATETKVSTVGAGVSPNRARFKKELGPPQPEHILRAREPVAARPREPIAPRATEPISVVLWVREPDPLPSPRRTIPPIPVSPRPPRPTEADSLPQEREPIEANATPEEACAGPHPVETDLEIRFSPEEEPAEIDCEAPPTEIDCPPPAAEEPAEINVDCEAPAQVSSLVCPVQEAVPQGKGQLPDRLPMTPREARNRALAQQKVVVPISRRVRFLSTPRTVFKPPPPVMAPISFVPLFRWFAGVPIDGREERDRLLCIRRQAGVGQSLGLELKVRRLVTFATEARQQRLVPVPIPPRFGHLQVPQAHQVVS
jgi:tubulin polyglutamylase TTLL6/13